MGRRIRIFAIFVLVGAVVNVTVAWGCFALPRPGPPPSQHWSDLTLEDEAWCKQRAPSFVTGDWELGPRVTGFNRLGRRVRSLTLYGFDNDGDHVGGAYAVKYDIGLPVTVIHMFFYERYSKSTGLTTSTDYYVGDWALPGSPWRVDVLWKGFVLNTAFYGLLLSALVSGPPAVRRQIRKRRGLCSKCGYPVGESGVCTECGKELAT